MRMLTTLMVALAGDSTVCGCRARRYRMSGGYTDSYTRTPDTSGQASDYFTLHELCKGWLGRSTQEDKTHATRPEKRGANSGLCDLPHILCCWQRSRVRTVVLYPSAHAVLCSWRCASQRQACQRASPQDAPVASFTVRRASTRRYASLLPQLSAAHHGTGFKQHGLSQGVCSANSCASLLQAGSPASSSAGA